LLQGLLDPAIEVFRYRNRRNGQIGYFTGADVEAGLEPEWQRDGLLELGEGITAAAAVELGLAEGIAEEVDVAASRGGLGSVPETLSDRPLVHWVEWFGALPWLPTLLVFAGFMALSIEVSAPGLGVPGFVSLLCFVFFFWMKFLSGTAEWLEVVLFAVGVLCLLIEVLLLPGTGVFGIGGLVMVVSAIVLTSQTFVLPQNDYQFEQMTRGLMTVVVAFLGIFVGVIALRYMLPGTPVFRQLVMPGPRSEEMHEQIERERLVQFEWLMGHEGVTITPLRPGGKAKFGDEVVAVVSDGSPLGVGQRVRVAEVYGNRVVVHSLEEDDVSAVPPQK
jgi:membrane-bound ClpP family serine protease